MLKFRIVLLAIFAVLPFFPSVAHADSGQLLSLPWSKWQFHLSDDPGCAASSPSCAWSASRPNASVKYEDFAFGYWQRQEIQIDPKIEGQPDLALLMQDVEPGYEVYANGRLIGASGSRRTRTAPLYSRQIFPIPRDAYASGRLVLTVHMLRLHMVNKVAYMDPWIGASAALVRQRDLDTFANMRAQWQHYLSYLLVFFVSLFFLLLFLIDRSAREHLWFALLLLPIALLRFFELGSVVDMGLSTPVAWLGYAMGNLLSPLAFVEFPFALLGRRVPWYFRIVQAGSFLPVILNSYALPLPHAVMAWVVALDDSTPHYIQHYLILSATLAWLVVLPKCFRGRLPEMRWIGGSMVFLFFEEINRHLTMSHLPGIPQNVAIGSLDFDVRASAYLVFAIVMLVAMTFRFRRIQERNRSVEQELAAAAAVQSLLLSSRSAAVGSFSVESVYHPAGEVGGDFFHVASDGQSGIIVVVGDVSGKGLKAAMTVATIIGALRDFAVPAPAAILAHLNRVLYGQIGGFVTCCVAHLRLDGTLRLANAGHIPPYCNGREFECAPGLPLGILEELEWTETEVRLDPETRLMFVSDGVVEAAKINGELFGFDRTRDVSGRRAEDIAAAAQAFSAGAPQNDDITVLGIHYQPLAVPVA